MFSLVDGVLLEPLGVLSPQWEYVLGCGRRPTRTFRAIRRPRGGSRNGSGGVAAFRRAVGGGGDQGNDPVVLRARPRVFPRKSVSADYFDVLGVEPILGHALLPDEAKTDRARPRSSCSATRPRRLDLEPTLASCHADPRH